MDQQDVGFAPGLEHRRETREGSPARGGGGGGSRSRPSSASGGALGSRPGSGARPGSTQGQRAGGAAAPTECVASSVLARRVRPEDLRTYRCTGHDESLCRAY